MANASPKIVFAVDLSNVQALSHLNPDMHTESSDLGRVNIADKAIQHRTLIPGLVPAKTYEAIHGSTITEYGAQAIYLLNNYGPSSSNPILTVSSRLDETT